MRVTVNCTSCGKGHYLEDNLLGKSVRCQKCGNVFKTAAPSDADKIKAGGSGPAPNVSPQAVTAAPTATQRSGDGVERMARFQIRAKLGAGAFGAVYRAFDPQLEREVALKVPQAGVLDNPKRVERFLREAKSAAQLRHPNIVPIFDAGQEDGNYYIASAFIDGHTLADTIDEKGMNPQRAAKIVARLAEALAYAHQLGIVHRDIKPANIMIDPDDQPHLMDFGLAARTESTEKLTQDGAVLGTPAYMAPEHAAGHSGESFPASDQYSLGVVLYEMLTGKTPWEGPPQIVLYNVLHKEPDAPRKLRKDIPKDLETICLKAMAKQSEHRFRDCQALADDLRRWLEGEPVKARRPNFGERFGRWLKREPKMAAAAALALAGAITLAVGLGLLAQHLNTEYGNEQRAHGKTKKSLDEEQAEHQLTKGDRYFKQVSLAREQIDGHDLLGSMHTLAACPPEMRGWEWGHLRQLAEGSPDAFHVLNGAGKVLHVHFSADSRFLFSQQPRGQRRIWELATLQSKDQTQPLKLDDWSRGKFSGDGQLIAEMQVTPVPVMPDDGPDKEIKFPPAKIEIKELATNKLFKEITIPGGMNVFTMSPDATKVAVAHGLKYDQPLKITIYDVQSGQELHKLVGEFLSVMELVFSPDAAALAVVYGGGVSTVKKLVATEEQRDEGGKTVTETVYKEVPETVMSGANAVKVLEIPSGTELLAIAKETMGMSRAVFSPDGKRFCFLTSEGVDVYSLGDNKEQFTLKGRTGALAFSPDNKRLATASGEDGCPPDGRIKIWDAATGRFIVALRTKGYTNAYDKLLFSPDGLWLAAVPFHGSQVFLFSTSGGRLLTPYYEHGVPVVSVTWSSDGKLLSSWSDCNRTTHVWEAGTGKTQLIAPNQYNAGLGFTTDVKYLTTGGGCLGAVPHQGYGMHGGFGGGCYGVAGFGGVNVFSASTFKPMPPPKGYESFLAASTNGKHWVLKPTLTKNGKGLTSANAPKLQLWSIADDKEAVALSELDLTSQVQFTDDGGRIVGIGHGPAKTTGYKTVNAIEEKIKTVKKKGKDGAYYDEQVKYQVTVCMLVPYEVTVFAPRLKLLDAATGNKVWQSYGVRDLFAVSSDGKLVATLPPPAPRQPNAMPAMPAPKMKEEAPPLKEAPLKTSAEEAISFQEPKKILATPAQAPIPGGPQQPDAQMPPPVIPSPPITLWVVDEKDKDGETVRRMLYMPGEVTMMKFSPDGKYLAAYTPEGWKDVFYKTTRHVIQDGKSVPVVEEHVRKERAPVLFVFETATGKQVLTHVGASGLALFCNGSGHIASAAGMPKFTMGHGGGGAPANHDLPPPPPGVEPKSARRASEPPLLTTLANDGIQVAALGQVPVPAQPAPAGPGDQEPTPIFQPNGAVCAPAGMPFVDTTLSVFDLKTGKETHKFQGHTSQITALAFSPDCQKLASGSYGTQQSCGDPPGKHFAQIIIWDMNTGKPYQIINGHTGNINCMEFDPEGKKLASASDDTTVKVWTVGASLNVSMPGYAVPAMPAPPGYSTSPGVVVQPAPVTPTPPVVQPQTTPAPAPVVEATIGEPTLQIPGHSPMTIAFAGNNRLLTPGGGDGFLVWETPAGKLQRVVKGDGHNFAVSGDGTRCATASFDGKLTVLDTSDWKTLHSWKLPDGNVRLQLDEKGTRLLTTSFFPGPVKVWDVQGKLIREFPGPAAAALSRDGKRVALGSGAGGGDKGPPGARLAEPDRDDFLVSLVQKENVQPKEGSIKIVDVDTGAVVKSIAAAKHDIRWLALRPDEKMIATAGHNTVSIWEIASGKEVHQLQGFGDAIFGLRFNSDGGTLSVGCATEKDQRLIHLIDVATGKRRHEIDAFGNLTCDFSPDGKMIAIAGAFTDLHLWDVATGKEIVPQTGGVGPFFAIHGSADGKSLLLAGKDRTIRRWDVATQTLGAAVKFDPDGAGKNAPMLEGVAGKKPAPGDDEFELPGQNSIMGAFSPDGGTLRIIRRQSMKLVDVASGQVRQSIDFGRHGGLFTPDGAKLVAAGQDGAIRIWEAATGRLLHTLKCPKKAMGVHIAPGGDRLVAFCNNNDGKGNVLVVFDAKSGAELQKRDWPNELSPPMAISPNGRAFVVAEWGHSPNGPPKSTLKLFDVDDLNNERLSFAVTSVGPMLFRADGNALYTAGQDAVLRVWELGKGNESASIPLGLVASGGTRHMCFVGPDRIACLNDMGTVTIVRLVAKVAAPKTAKAMPKPIPAGPPRFVPVAAPKFDARPGNLVFDDALATPEALAKFFHASGQYYGRADHDKGAGLRLAGGHSSPLAWAQPFLGDHYRVQFEVQFKAEHSWAGWCLSGSGSGNSPESGYWCRFNKFDFWFQREGKMVQQALPMPKSVTSGTWFNVLADVDGGKISVVIDDTLVAQFTDPSPLAGPLHGWFGLHAGDAVYRNLKIWTTAQDTKVARQLTPPPTVKPLPNGELRYELKLADNQLGSEWWQSQPKDTNVKATSVILHGGNASPEIILSKPLSGDLAVEIEFEYASLPHEAVNFSVILWNANKAPQSAKECDGGWLVSLPSGDGKNAIRWHRGPKDGAQGVWTEAPIVAATPYHAPVYQRKYLARVETQGDVIRVFLDGGLLLTAKKPAGATAESSPTFLGLRQVYGGSTVHAVRVYRVGISGEK